MSCQLSFASASSRHANTELQIIESTIELDLWGRSLEQPSASSQQFIVMINQPGKHLISVCQIQRLSLLPIVVPPVPLSPAHWTDGAGRWALLVPVCGQGGHQTWSIVNTGKVVTLYCMTNQEAVQQRWTNLLAVGQSACSVVQLSLLVTARLNRSSFPVNKAAACHKT